MTFFEIDNLHVNVEGREILRGVDLTVERGEVHALMGRNGSGKSTLALALMGHPKYQVTSGAARLNGEDLLGLPPDERARRGVFLGFQNPTAIPGVATGNFLRAAVKAVRGGEAKRAEVLQLAMLKPCLAVLDEPDSGLDIDAVRIVSEGVNTVHAEQPDM